METCPNMTTGLVRPRRPAFRRRRASSSSGFSLIELMLTAIIALVLTVIAVPMFQSITGYMRLRAAVASVTGAVQTTRYNAIYNGYPYQVTFSKANQTFQVANEAGGATTFTDVGTAVPYTTSTKVQLNQDTVFQFRPSGVVNVTTGSNVMTVSVGSKVATITVSGLGNVNVKYN
jgi:Tfp pilus assembly protein FimT